MKTPQKINLRSRERRIQRKLILKNLRKTEIIISDDEVEFFRKYPEELELMTDTLAAKKLYLWLAAGFGFLLVALSIFFRFNPIIGDDNLFHGFFLDLTFEGGVALWGAAITVYLLEIVLDNQTDINEAYRQAVMKRISGEKRQ
ncbi:MAG: hypothetical protein OER04_09870 [Cyclobacteriaceae bacterium]|nr:hypothetical protein [Cyclobacteriaceae bacterium]